MIWKVLKAELAEIFNRKLNIIKWSAVILIPFIYSFTYLFAFWNPYQYLNNLKLAIVNNDNDYKKSHLNIGTAISNGLTKDDVLVEGYKIHINQATAHSDITNLLKDYYAVVEIPQNFTTSTIKTIEGIVKQENNLTDLPQINFFNSFKNNFLIAEVGGFVSSMTPIYVLGLKVSLPTIENIVKQDVDQKFWPYAESFFTNFSTMLDHISNHPIFKLSSSAPQLNSYGFGLAPYFLCIGLWVGQLVQHFMISKKRKIKNAKLMSNYFGKSLFLMMNASIQSIILLVGLSCIGLRLSGWNEVGLIIFVMFMACLFTLIIQTIMFALKKPDIGRFIVIILLVLQLTSSSGTFPVALQPVFFRIVGRILPFTYTINIIREIFFDPIYIKILIDVIILLSYLAVMIPLSLWMNHRKESKTKRSYDEDNLELEYLKNS